MQQAALILTFSSDAVFSARAATVGGHSGLDCIPGAALLGWAAGQLYGEAGCDAYQIFHSGKVRFGNGYPLIELEKPDDETERRGKIAFPVPQVLLKRKAEREEEQKDKLEGGRLCIHPNGFGKDIQAEAVSKMYIANDGTIGKRRTGYRMKTAIEDNRAAENQLFGYQYLEAGQSFVACLEADDDVPAKIFDQLCTLFDDETLSLGRSRRAEFGGEIYCQVDRQAGEKIWSSSGVLDQNKEKRITVWLLSDLAVDDENGVPSLAPSPELLGLPAGKLIEEESIIAPKRYAPFNNYLRRPELERGVISAGSVLRYELNEPVDASSIKCADCVGLYRETGLGRVWINPSMLAGTEPDFTSEPEILFTISKPEEVLIASAQAVYASDLANWLHRKLDEGRQATDREKRIDRWFGELELLYETAGAILGQAAAGPSASQWGRIKGICEDITLASLDDVAMKLVGLENEEPEQADKKTKSTQHAICRDDAGWELRGQVGGKLTTFRGWMISKLNKEARKEYNDVRDLKLTIGKLAERAQTLAKDLLP